MEALGSARDALTALQVHQAFYSDRGRVELNVGVGDQVLVHREFLVTPEARARPCHKLRPKWFGPFKVIERISANTFRIDLPHTLHCHLVFNVAAIKKYFPSDMKGRNVPPPAPINDLDGMRDLSLKRFWTTEEGEWVCSTLSDGKDIRMQRGSLLLFFQDEDAMISFNCSLTSPKTFADIY